MLTRPRPAAGEPRPESPADLLRAGGQDALVAGAVLTVVLAGAVVNLALGRGTGLPGLLVLPGLAATFTASAVYAVRARLLILRTLGEVRARIGAPLDPGVPWTPAGSHGALDERAVRREIRRLVGAAYRCHGLSLNALLWAAVTVVLFVVWLLA
ncbi:MAG TPA: hypothetical protein VHJ17_11885 [Thermomonospora sp.]|nr:hypothetical protein [Thermomonospora sp.]